MTNAICIIGYGALAGFLAAGAVEYFRERSRRREREDGE